MSLQQKEDKIKWNVLSILSSFPSTPGCYADGRSQGWVSLSLGTWWNALKNTLHGNNWNSRRNEGARVVLKAVTVVFPKAGWQLSVLLDSWANLLCFGTWRIEATRGSNSIPFVPASPLFAFNLNLFFSPLASSIIKKVIYLRKYLTDS